ncbi:MAG: AAA family ATPase, partial [Thermoplasmata archaeon]|nr:AAA family ATPase [Thermoplasmata archaeon]
MSASVPPTPHRPPALLSEKYRPTRLEDLIGNGRARSELRAWANSWTHGPPPRFRAALLDGPAGVGKTSATHAVAADMGWEVVELNASDARNRTAIERVAGRTALTQAFGLDGSFTSVRDGGRTLILLDEADCLTGRAAEEVATKRPTTSFREFLRSRYVDISSLNKAWELTTESTPKAFEAWSDAPATRGRGAWGRLRAAQRDLQDWEGTRTPTDRSDRGGLGAIDELVRTTLQPLVLTVNDPSPLTRYSKTFRQNVARIPFHAVDPDEIRRLLRKVVLAEGIQITPAALEAIVVRSQGDVRAALTDLDAIAPLPAGREQLLVLSPRDQGINLEPFLAEVLQRPRWYRSVEIRDRVDTPPEDLIPWIEENL